MKLWCSKYSLSKGIMEIDGEICDDGNMVKCREMPMIYLHGEGNEWHRTREDAVHRAKQMREAKLRALAKQIKKLEALEF